MVIPQQTMNETGVAAGSIGVGVVLNTDNFFHISSFVELIGITSATIGSLVGLIVIGKFLYQSYLSISAHIKSKSGRYLKK